MAVPNHMLIALGISLRRRMLANLLQTKTLRASAEQRGR
jgi:hypothetical protein